MPPLRISRFTFAGHKPVFLSAACLVLGVGLALTGCSRGQQAPAPLVRDHVVLVPQSIPIANPSVATAGDPAE